VFVYCPKDVGGNGKGQFKGLLGSWVGSREVGGGWFHWSSVVVIIEEVVSKWAKSKERINTEWESLAMFLSKKN
jgi:hypothetical protein